MTAALLGTVLAASLAGSLHCAGMCGGFVAFYAGSDVSGGSRRAIGHAAYSAGRLASYLLVGVSAGLLGAALDGIGARTGLARAAALAAGTLMVAWGGIGLLRAAHVRIPVASLPAGLRRAIVGAQRVAMRDRAPVVRALLLGLFSALLPCGWMWGFAVLASGTGSPWLGMLVLGAFWIGTLPAMLGLGLSLQFLGRRARARIPVVAAATLLALGLLWLTGRAGLPGVSAPTATHEAGHCAPAVSGR